MTIDLDRFEKLVRLAESVPHEDSTYAKRERDVAWGRARAVAEGAGMTLEEALDILNDPPNIKPANPFADFFAEHAAQQARAQRHPWPKTAWERLLDMAVVGHRIEGMAVFWDDLPQATLAAIRGAFPWPTTIRDALAEEATWNALEAGRKAVMEAYSLHDAAWIRRSMLADVILGHAATVEDMVSRARAFSCPDDRGARANYNQDDLLKILAADIERLASMSASGTRFTGVATRTNREKRKAVATVLSGPGGWDLSIREVARRAGVSVQGAKDIREAIRYERVSA